MAAVPQASLDGHPLALKKGPPLTYHVKRGDTISRIAQHHGCSVKELLAWNKLKPSARLKRGEVLQVASPEAVREAKAAAAAAIAAAANVTARTAVSIGSATTSSKMAGSATVDATAAGATAARTTASPANPTGSSGTVAATATPSTTTDTTGTPTASQPLAPTAAAAPPPDAAEARQVAAEMAHHAKAVALAWPAQGSVVEGFQAGETRGIEISGKPGDPVRAAADGRVMYAGTGLNEYGSLIIVQHNKDFLTAYSHNRRLLVKTGDIVRQGQEIAEMGNENNSRVSVMFELRHDGKPIDPMPFLPAKQG
ncbi:peptidoglycan DD-metalloendopeptidase family protein [Paraburkholderia sp. DHOC27]|uniref:peptidoglycan DD-metalloendopeptidase family protein n=1 Tax=Paraburkholderia sp. DHOC27 TaxID=2303330 RepID=UPI003857D614